MCRRSSRRRARQWRSSVRVRPVSPPPTTSCRWATLVACSMSATSLAVCSAMRCRKIACRARYWMPRSISFVAWARSSAKACASAPPSRWRRCVPRSTPSCSRARNPSTHGEPSVNSFTPALKKTMTCALGVCCDNCRMNLLINWRPSSSSPRPIVSDAMATQAFMSSFVTRDLPFWRGRGADDPAAEHTPCVDGRRREHCTIGDEADDRPRTPAGLATR